MARASRAGHVSAAHDLSDGGLAQVLVESCLRRNVGARVALPADGNSAFVHLFSESAGRALVAVPRGHDKAFVALAAEFGVPCTPIGVTSPEAVLEVRDEFAIPLGEVRAAWSATLPLLFGGSAEPVARIGAPEDAAGRTAPEAADDGSRGSAVAEAGDESVRTVTLELTDPDPARPVSGPALSESAVSESAVSESAVSDRGAESAGSRSESAVSESACPSPRCPSPRLVRRAVRRARRPVVPSTRSSRTPDPPR